MPTSITPWRRWLGRTVGSSANSGSRMNGERSSSFWRDVSRAPPSRWRRWATPTLHRRSTNDQALRLRPRPDPAREHQLLDVDHGNVVRTAHRNERRLAVPAEPSLRAALADRQALHFSEGPRVEDLGEGVLAIGDDRVATIAGPLVSHRLLVGRLRCKHRPVLGLEKPVRTRFVL